MYLLIRKISSYTGSDLLLGVFVRQQAAEGARIEYSKRYSRDPQTDPWYDQGYKSPGLSAEDLLMLEFEFEGPIPDVVFVVSRYSYGFGQVLRAFDSVYPTQEAATARIARIAEWARERTFPPEGDCQRVPVGVLLSDAREDQPRW
ncbi:MAG: hypothetical protein ACK58L_21355 [Planctomycetota bacterium]